MSLSSFLLSTFLLSTTAWPDDISRKLFVTRLLNAEMITHLNNRVNLDCSGKPTPKDCKILSRGVCEAEIRAYFGKPDISLEQSGASQTPKMTGLSPSDSLLFEGQFLSVNNTARYVNHSFKRLGEDSKIRQIEFSLKQNSTQQRVQMESLRELFVNLPAGRTLNLSHNAEISKDGSIVVTLNKSEQNDLDIQGKELLFKMRSDCFIVQPNEKVWEYPLKTAAREDSTTVGTLIVKVLQGQNIRYFFRPQGSAHSANFIPDMAEAATGFGIAADHTALDEDKGWVLLPEGPFPQPVWLKRIGENSPLKSNSAVYFFKAPPRGRLNNSGELKTVPLQRFVIVNQKSDVLIIGEEPTEQSCEVKSALYWIPISELYDSHKHLTIGFAYTRGCE